MLTIKLPEEKKERERCCCCDTGGTRKIPLVDITGCCGHQQRKKKGLV